MDWTDKKAKDAEKELRRWHELTHDVDPTTIDKQVVEAVADDLGTASAITLLRAFASNARNIEKFENADGSSKLHGAQPTYSSLHWKGILKASAQFLGLLTDELGGWRVLDGASHGLLLADLTERLSVERMAAMTNKDFSEVDRLKAAFVAAGLEVRMSKAGVELLPGPGFDPAKLEGL